MVMKKQLLIIVILFFSLQNFAQELVADKRGDNTFSLIGTCIYTDPNNHQLVQVTARHLQGDLGLITGDPGLALQKIVMDLGGLLPSYLGPLETIVK